jgi:Arc/MetJ family transcription regulator
MKMTMHIDDELLERVIQLTGASSKTEAVSLALKEMDRKARLAEFGRKGLGLTRAELIGAVDPGYDLMALRVAEETPSGAAETMPPKKKVTYATKKKKKKKN